MIKIKIKNCFDCEIRLKEKCETWKNASDIDKAKHWFDLKILPTCPLDDFK
jgi:hypothetical protein